MIDKIFCIYAGCNGAGKTTAFEGTLHLYINNLKNFDYLNADIIARGISPLNPESVSIEAARILIKQINNLFCQGKSFAVETTLSGKSYLEYIKKAKSLGYNVILFYYWLNSVELPKERVKLRVKNGGHNIPENDIARRYFRGINNLFSLYLPMVDSAFLYDNSNEKPYLIAEFNRGNIVIINENIYKQLYILWQQIYINK
jgi:predicted ABC-type ATPase